MCTHDVWIINTLKLCTWSLVLLIYYCCYYRHESIESKNWKLMDKNTQQTRTQSIYHNMLLCIATCSYHDSLDLHSLGKGSSHEPWQLQYACAHARHVHPLTNHTYYFSMMKTVAIIGAGAAGLCCARHFSRYPNLFQIRVFEKGSEIGGTWVYENSRSHCIESLRDVRDTTKSLDDGGSSVHSSMYKNLR